MAISDSERVNSDAIRADIEDYIRRASSGVTSEEIKSVLSDKYGLEGTAWKTFVYNTANVTRVAAGRFMHVDRLPLQPDPAGFLPIIDYINSWLEAEGLVTARKVFRDQAEACASLGIISPEHLYSILKASYYSDYDLPWFPQIIKWGVRQPGVRTCGVTSEIEDYLERRACECTYSELVTYFVKERGYLRPAVTGIAKSRKVARYTPDSVIHLKALGWTDRLQQALERCALSRVRLHGLTDRQHPRLSELMESPALPGLPAEHPWTATLLEDLLCRRGNFVLSTVASECRFIMSRDYEAEDTSSYEPALPAADSVSGAPEIAETLRIEDPYSEAVARLSERAILVLKAHGVSDLQGFLSIRESRLRITLGATSEIVDEILYVRDELILGSRSESKRDETSGTSLGYSRPRSERIQRRSRPPEPRPMRRVRKDGAKGPERRHSPAPALRGGTPLPGEFLGGLTVRARNVLRKSHITAVEQLLALSKQDLHRLPNAGDKTVAELMGLQAQLRDAEFAADRILPAGVGMSRRTERPEDLGILRHPVGFGRESAVSGLVADLGLSESDLACLRKVAVFPDDSLESLSCVALEVLVPSGISETGFDTVLRACSDSAGLEVSDAPIVREADVLGMEGWSVRTIGVPQRDAETLRVCGICTLGDALGHSEKSVVDSLGLGICSLMCIRLLRQLGGHASQARLNTPPSDYASFDSVARYTTEPPGSKPKEIRAYKTRTGLLDGAFRTYRQAGLEIGVTGERIRQLERKHRLRLDRPSGRTRLTPLLSVIRGIVEDCGGACTDAELARHLTERFTWSSCPDAGRAVALASLDPSLCLSKDRRLVSFASPCPCLVCEIPMKAIADSTREAGGAIGAGDCADRVDPIISQTCRQCEYHRARFSQGYILLRAASHPELRVEDDRIICMSVESAMRDVVRARHDSASSDRADALGQSGDLPPASKRKPLRSRRARVQKRFDFAARQLMVHIGEQKLEGEFSEQAHVRAILRDGEGTELESRILDAYRAPKGAIVRPIDIGLPVIEGDLTVDIEYAGDVLQTYPMETLLADEPCMLFSGSGALVRGAVRDRDDACVLLREGAQVLPEDAVRSREPLQQGEPYDLAWLDMQATAREGLVVQWNGVERAFQVITGRGGRGVVLEGGDRVSRVSGDEQRPVYGSSMPDLVIEQKLSQLRLAVTVSDTGRLLDRVIDGDGRVSLGEVLDQLGVPGQSVASIDLAWTDLAGKSGKVSLVRIPDLLVSFEQRAYVPERDKVAKARLTLPPGWQLLPGSGIRSVGLGRDGAELGIEIDLRRPLANARLRRGKAKVPIAIQPPTVQWRVESGQRGGERPWQSSTAEIWAEDVDARRYEALAVMIDADCPVRVALGSARPQWCTPEKREARFDLSELVQAIRQGGPAGSLRLTLVDSGRRQIPPIDVATVFDRWIPIDPVAKAQSIAPGATSSHRIELSWSGPVPRRPATMTLRPAWMNSAELRSSARAGAHTCTFSADAVVCGPYILAVEDADAEDWGDSAAPSDDMLIWIGGSEPQIRDFELTRRGDSWACRGVVYPGAECSGLVGVVMRNRAGARTDMVDISYLGDGRFEFVVDDAKEDAGIVGVMSAPRGAHGGLYRFGAVEHGPGCSEMLSMSRVREWLRLSERFPDAVKMWIGGFDVKPIPVPRVASRRILEELAAGSTTVRFSPDDPDYRGAVELAIPDDGCDDQGTQFELSFGSALVRCIDDRCSRRGEVLSQEKWSTVHGARCKSCQSLGREIRAGFAMQIDISSVASKNAFDTTVVDSCFRHLVDNPATVLGTDRLGQMLMDALRDRWRMLGAASTHGEEIES